MVYIDLHLFDQILGSANDCFLLNALSHANHHTPQRRPQKSVEATKIIYPSRQCAKQKTMSVLGINQALFLDSFLGDIFLA